LAEAYISKNERDAWLRHAAAQDDVKRVRELIGLGANPYAMDNKSMTAFNHAASNGLQALKFLTEEAFADTQRPPGQRKWPKHGINTPSGKYHSTLLTYACKVCDAATVENMIAHDADRSVVNDSGWNLLHVAAVMPGRLEVLHMLRNYLEPATMHAQTTQPYETGYGKHQVRYDAGLTPYQLCRARIDQDPGHPKELAHYLAALTPGAHTEPERLGAIPRTPG
jgi:ankyrin repeat protein